jgi:hypothetical protein
MFVGRDSDSLVNSARQGVVVVVVESEGSARFQEKRRVDQDTKWSVVQEQLRKRENVAHDLLRKQKFQKTLGRKDLSSSVNFFDYISQQNRYFFFISLKINLDLSPFHACLPRFTPSKHS